MVHRSNYVAHTRWGTVEGLFDEVSKGWMSPRSSSKAGLVVDSSRSFKWQPDSPAKATVIMFHGNAAIIEFNGIVHQRALESSCNIMSVAYRGYGHSTGTPSETGLRLDAQTALDYVLKQPDLSKNIILYGHSLGGAVSIDLASRNPDKIAGLIIQSTFNSIPKLMSRFPILVPFLFTILQRWESDIKLWSLPRSIPILMLCGLKDQVIPPLEMRILMDVAKLREGGGGSDGSGMGYFERWRARNVIGRIRNARWRAWKNGGGDAAVMEDVDGDILREVIKEIGQRKEPARVITHWFPKADHNNLFEQEGYFERVQAFLRDEVLDLKASEKLVAVDDDEKHAGKYN
ncbi:hypothetical protein AX16_007828 [Volvariella volvacea WC 439]|nr:hypothetical protein AX16_007828 [Volvariella volvacea WC 439]